MIEWMIFCKAKWFIIRSLKYKEKVSKKKGRMQKRRENRGMKGKRERKERK